MNSYKCKKFFWLILFLTMINYNNNIRLILSDSDSNSIADPEDDEKPIVTTTTTEKDYDYDGTDEQPLFIKEVTGDVDEMNLDTKNHVKKRSVVEENNNAAQLKKWEQLIFKFEAEDENKNKRRSHAYSELEDEHDSKSIEKDTTGINKNKQQNIIISKTINISTFHSRNDDAVSETITIISSRRSGSGVEEPITAKSIVETKSNSNPSPAANEIPQPEYKSLASVADPTLSNAFHQLKTNLRRTAKKSLLHCPEIKLKILLGLWTMLFEEEFNSTSFNATFIADRRDSFTSDLNLQLVFCLSRILKHKFGLESTGHVLEATKGGAPSTTSIANDAAADEYSKKFRIKYIWPVLHYFDKLPQFVLKIKSSDGNQVNGDDVDVVGKGNK